MVRGGEAIKVDNYPLIGHEYAEIIASEKVETNKLLVKSTTRYLKMLELAESGKADYTYSPLHVVDYCRFVESLNHIDPGLWAHTQFDDDGNVNPKIILEPWQLWIESAIHGFRSKHNGTRLVTTAFEMSPRKSAKTLRLAPAALYDLCYSGDINPQITVAAMSQRQANDTLFGAIGRMIAGSPDLVEAQKITRTKDEIRKGEGRIFMLTSQGERLDGLNPSLALFEEFHAGQRKVYEVVRSAFGARPNALMRVITTAGHHQVGPAWEMQKKATAVLNGDYQEDTFFPAVYTLDKEDYINPETNGVDYAKILDDENLWRKANPMWGISLDPVKIRSEAESAKHAPLERGEFTRARLNIWSSAGTALIDPMAWDACKRDIKIDEFIGNKCWVGVDWATRQDMCSIALLFEYGKDGLAVFAEFYVPEEAKVVQEPDHYDVMMLWAEQKHLTIQPGALADRSVIVDAINTYCELFDVQAIVVDASHAHEPIKEMFEAGLPIFEYPNRANTMTIPTLDLLDRVKGQSIIHDGHPVLAWNAQNVHGDFKGNMTIMPRKADDNSIKKIDGIVALVMANGQRINMKSYQKDAPTVSPYETGRLLSPYE